MLIVGERINTTRKPIAEAVTNRDADFILNEASSQIEAGAALVDVNAGSRHKSEVEDLTWLIETIQKCLPEARLCVDSPYPKTLAAVLDMVVHTPMINSTTAESARFEAMAPIIQKRECDIVALCIDDRGIPKSAKQALENAAKLVADLQSIGVKPERIYLDPIIQAVSTNQKAGLIALETIETIRRDHEGVNVVCGLSNISFGLPRRSLINRTFLTLAMKAGLNSAIIDPKDINLMGALRAAAVLLGNDDWCQAYTKASRAGLLP